MLNNNNNNNNIYDILNCKKKKHYNVRLSGALFWKQVYAQILTMIND